MQTATLDNQIFGLTSFGLKRLDCMISSIISSIMLAEKRHEQRTLLNVHPWLSSGHAISRMNLQLFVKHVMNFTLRLISV
jgi:hypothetical protein